MSDKATLTITLPVELAEKLRDADERGAFPSTDEAIAAALYAWDDAQDPNLGWSDEELGRLWDEGIASGPSIDGPSAFRNLLKRNPKADEAA